MSKREQQSAALLSGVASHPELLPAPASEFRTTSEILTTLEAMRVISLPEVARLNDLSIDTLRRRYSHLFVRTSANRIGMRLKDALAIAQPLSAPAPVDAT